MKEMKNSEITKVHGGAVPLIVVGKIAFNVLGGMGGAYALGKTLGGYLKLR